MKKTLNPWTEMSVEYANQRNYLDDLFCVYPTIPEGIREIDKDVWKAVERSFKKQDNLSLLQNLLKLELFPVKDSYVAYFRRDEGALERNPATVDRLAGRLYEMGLDEIHFRSSEPKETNRQIGPLFRRWLRSKSLGVAPVKPDKFPEGNGNAVLDASDSEAKAFAREHLNYRGNKGLDLVGRFNGKYVVGEAKFLTDFGGHQSAQFNDAVDVMRTRGIKAITVAILDGVVYIEGGHKFYREITGRLKKENIMSALVLREFLYQV